MSLEFCPWVKPGTDDEEMLAGIFMIANDLEEAPRTPFVDYASKDIKKVRPTAALFLLFEIFSLYIT